MTSGVRGLHESGASNRDIKASDGLASVSDGLVNGYKWMPLTYHRLGMGYAPRMRLAVREELSSFFTVAE